MLMTVYKITKKAIREAIKAGRPVGDHILMNTSLHGNEVKEGRWLTVCLDHPRRSVYANVWIEDCKIVKIK